MVKIHLIRTTRSTRSSRALIAAGPPHPERIVKQPPTESSQSSRGKVVYGPGAGTPVMRMRNHRPGLVNVTHWVSLPFGWALAIEGKHREQRIREQRRLDA